jgi:hypothetical protein
MTGESVSSNQVMDFVMTQYSKTGAQGGRFRITDVSFNPKFNFNLFSAARCLSQGWTMSGSKKDITLTSPCGTHKIVFDIVVHTPKGAIFATMLKRQQEFANAEVKATLRPISLKEAHAKLGHCDIEKTKRTARKLGWDIKDTTMTPCASCAAGKASKGLFLSPQSEIKQQGLVKDGITTRAPLQIRLVLRHQKAVACDDR